MKSKQLKTKLAALAATGVVLFTSHLPKISATILETSHNPFSNTKPYEQILKDSENFNVSTDIINKVEFSNKNGSGYLRMKMSEDNPVVIEYDKSMEEREKKLIEAVANYYNNVFSTINENYKFKVQEKGNYIPKNSTTISIKNTNEIEHKDVSAKGMAISHTKSQEKNEGALIVGADVLLDWEKLKNENDLYIYVVILHEITHTLGFDDVYNHGSVKTTNIINNETFMNTNNSNKISILYPNDYAILQVLYSNEYKKHNDYQKAVEVVNKKIEEYTKSFYKLYGEMLKEKGTATGNLANETIEQNINWKSAFTNNKNTCNLKINQDNTCEFTIYGNDGTLLEKSTGSIMYVDGILFARNITINNANNYNNKLNNELGINLMLSFYIDKTGTLVVNDGSSTNYPSFKKENIYMSR